MAAASAYYASCLLPSPSRHTFTDFFACFSFRVRHSPPIDAFIIIEITFTPHRDMRHAAARHDYDAAAAYATAALC